MSKREMDKIVDKIVKDAKDKLGIEQPAKCGVLLQFAWQSYHLLLR